jgi:lambda family phage tail tape measure protein
MATIGSLMVDIGANVARLQTDMQRCTSVVSQASRQMQGSFAAVKATAETIGTALLGAFGIKAILDIGMRADKAMDHMRYTFVENTDAMVSKAKEMSDKFQNFWSFSEISQAMMKTNDVMMELGLTQQEYLAGLQRAGDISAAKDFESIADGMRLLERAAMGAKKSALELGVVVGDDKMTEIAAKYGKVWKELDDGSKTLLRYHVIMRDTAKYQGAAANEAEDLEGALKRLKTSTAAAIAPEALKLTKDLADNINKLIPTIKNITTAFGSLLNAYTAFPDEIKGALGMGIVGRVLFGSWAPAALITAATAAVNVMNTLHNLSLGPSPDPVGDKVREQLNSMKTLQDLQTKYNQQFKSSTMKWGTVPKPSAVGVPDLTDRLKNKPGDLSKILGFADIDQYIRQLEDKANEVKKYWFDQDTDLKIMIAKNTGDILRAEFLEIEKWIVDAEAQIWKRIEDAQNKYIELQQKLEKSGATADAVKAVNDAKSQLDRTWYFGLSALNETLPGMRDTKRGNATQDEWLSTQRVIAEMGRQWAELSDSRQGYFKAETWGLQVELANQLKGVEEGSAKWLAITQAYGEKIKQTNILASGSFADGLALGFQKFKSEIPTAAEAGVEAFNSLKNGIDSAADALSEFVMTGKLEFTDLANSIIKDIIRMQMKSMIMQGLSGLGDLLGVGNLFSGAGGAKPAVSGAVKYYHGGGVVGSGSAPSRTVPMSIFAGAPRLHGGLAADEYPAILQRGETVIPRGGAPQSQKQTVEIKIENQSGIPMKVEKGVVDFQLNKMVVGIMLKQVNDNTPLGQLFRGGGRR